MNALRVCMAVIAALGFSCVPCSAQGCKTWAQALAKSFFPHQVDEPSLRTFSSLSAQEYFKAISQAEEKNVAERLAQGVALQHDATFGDVQSQLNTALAGVAIVRSGPES